MFNGPVGRDRFGAPLLLKFLSVLAFLTALAAAGGCVAAKCDCGTGVLGRLPDVQGLVVASKRLRHLALMGVASWLMVDLELYYGYGWLSGFAEPLSLAAAALCTAARRRSCSPRPPARWKA